MLVEIIEEAQAAFRVRSIVDQVVAASIPIDDYQAACAYAQGIVAGYNLALGGGSTARVIYPDPSSNHSWATYH